MTEIVGPHGKLIIDVEGAEEPKDIDALGKTLVSEVESITILSDEMYKAVAKVVKDAKAFQAEVDATFDPTIQAAHRAHKAALDAKKEKRAPFERAEKLGKAALLEWDEEQRRVAKERADKIEAEKLRKAEELAEAGQAEEADRILDTPPAIVDKPEAPAGVSYAQTPWKARIVDASKIPERFKVVDIKALNAHARATKGKDPVPGVEFYRERTARVI